MVIKESTNWAVEDFALLLKKRYEEVAYGEADFEEDIAEFVNNQTMYTDKAIELFVKAPNVVYKLGKQHFGDRPIPENIEQFVAGAIDAVIEQQYTAFKEIHMRAQ